MREREKCTNLNYLVQQNGKVPPIGPNKAKTCELYWNRCLSDCVNRPK